MASEAYHMLKKAFCSDANDMLKKPYVMMLWVGYKPSNGRLFMFHE
jgi:hypothetical protein